MAAAKLLFPVPHLESWRIQRKVSQQHLALAAQIGRATIVRLEHGASARTATIEHLAAALQLTPDQLLGSPPRAKRRQT